MIVHKKVLPSREESPRPSQKGVVIHREGTELAHRLTPTIDKSSPWRKAVLALGLLLAVGMTASLFSLLLIAQDRVRRIEAALALVQSELDKRLLDAESFKSKSVALSGDVSYLKNLHFKHLISSAAAELLDPREAKSLYEDAKDFAASNEILSDEIDTALDKLPAAKSFPKDGFQIDILSARHAPPALVIDFVVSKDGKFINDLGRVDVEVFNGARRLRFIGVSRFQAQRGEASVAVLFDTSGSTKGPAFEQMQKAGIHFCQSMSQTCPMKIWQFADNVAPLTEWALANHGFQKAISDMKPVGATQLHSVIQEAASALAMRGGERFIVLFTDGRDSDNTVDPQKVIDLCRKSNVKVYCVALHTEDTDEAFLQRLSTETGGGFISVAEPKQLVASFAEVAEKLKQPAYRIVALDAVDATKPFELKVANLPAKALVISAE